MKNYAKIERLKQFNCESVVNGDYIVIQEKIDGSNASFEYDGGADCIRAYSRRKELNCSETLQGFYGYTQSLDKLALNKNFLYFGEWLVKHTVVYPDEKYKQFYCFDIYDKANDIWLPQEQVTEVANKLNLHLVPTFYTGVFVDWEHVYSFVGKTDMGGEIGEGVVIKKVGICPDYYIKIIGEKFAETKNNKPSKSVSLKKLAARELEVSLTKTIVTKQRVIKAVYKLIEDNLIMEGFGLGDMKLLSKVLPKAIYDDCMKEEYETVEKIENFGRLCAKETMIIAREVAKENELL